MDGNFAWLRQKTEDPKSNKERKLTLPTHRVNVTELNCKVVRKVITPPFLHQPPFSGLSSLSSKNVFTIQFLKGPTHPPPFNKG